MAEDPQRSHELSNGAKAAVETILANGKPNHMTPSTWTPSSWTTKPIKQDVVYEDRAAVEKALAKLERLPPLVTPTEIEKLKRSLKDVALGKAFLLQGGDCAELFDYCEEESIESKIKLLLQMSLVLIWGINKPVVRIARMAGQFAKPRSSPTEIVDGKEVPSFRGDILNGYPLPERQPDPSRLVSAYFHSAATLNYLRASLASGIADLHSPMNWNLGHVQDTEIKAKYQQIVTSITESLAFMRTVGADTADTALETVDLYTSHEGLLLDYEQSLTRHLPRPTPSPLSTDTAPPKKAWYDTSAHFLWIGDRTRQLAGAHVEFFRGLANPIGIKVGPTLSAPDLVRLLATIDPAREAGKVTLITRYGAARIAALLPSHIAAVRAAGHVVVWQCDPMHGNTRSTPAGIKTRRFGDILAEVAAALRIHRAEGSLLGGVHLELTGGAVTECVGGSEGLTEGDLEANYRSFCDPRLNERQALELAFLVAGYFRGEGGGSAGLG